MWDAVGIVPAQPGRRPSATTPFGPSDVRASDGRASDVCASDVCASDVRASGPWVRIRYRDAGTVHR